MKPSRIVIAAALAGTCAFAQSESAVTEAANNPSSIHAAVAELDSTKIAAFASEVIDAIATMPKNPVTKVFSLVESSQNLLAEAVESNMADVIVALISNVPFEALPEWTTQMFASVQEVTADIEEAPYNKLVADVISKIGDLEEFTDDDKVVVTAFAIKLLSRGKDVYDEEPIRSALAAVPGTYRGQVESSLGAVLAGDYSGLLAGVDVIVIPSAGDADASATEAPSEDGFEPTKGAEIIPSKGTEPSEPSTPATPSTPSRPKPPVPPPYAEQF